MNRLRSLFTGLSIALYRGEARPVPALERAGRLAYLAVFSAAFVVLCAAVSSEKALWSRVVPEFPVARSDWRARVLPSPLGCKGEGCPLRASDAFWREAPSLDDAATKSALREGKAGEVWLALHVPAERLSAIVARDCTHFILGWLKGDYSVWLSGDLVQRISDEEYGAQTFAFPESLLRRGGGLDLVIRLAPRPGAKNLVPFTAGMTEGFGDYRAAHAFRSFHKLTGSSKPFALFLVYFVLSLIFFLLWRASPKNREYFHLSAFALVCCLPNLLYSDGFSFHLWPDFGMRLYLVIVFAKATTALNLGLTFSRARPDLVLRSSLVTMATGLLLVVFCSVPTLSGFRMPLNQRLISGAYLLGAAACVLQAWALLIREKEGFSFKLRQRKLFQFGFILAALAAIQFFQYGRFVSSVNMDLYWDLPEVVLALFLGFIALSDYRTQYEMVEKTPVSAYHKRATLPDSVAGMLMMVDLKNSERIFRSSLDETDPFQMPSIISAIWTAVADAGGTVIKAEGDEVIAFFDQEHCANPLSRALHATDLCQDRLDRLSRAGTRYVPKLAFRAGLSYGQIRPIWVGEGSERLPSWTQTGGSMVFVECARLMEAEKALAGEGGSPESLAVLPHDLLQRFELEVKGLRGEVVARAERVRGKHDRIYSVTCYRPGPAAQEERLVA